MTVARGHIVIRRKAKDGTDGQAGQSSFKSIVFKRAVSMPATPSASEGSYDSPVPSGWSDGVPEGSNQLWMSSRIFTNNGLSPQQSSWAEPKAVTDTADIDFEYSAISADPGTPSTSPSNWHDPATEDDIWMAVRKCKNGVWGSWSVTKIKGEDGQDGTDGDSIQVQFSVDGTSSWHATFASGDKYMRERIGSNSWSDAIKIVGENGADGQDGADGDDGSWTSFVFKASQDGRPATPSGTNPVPTGWSDEPPVCAIITPTCTGDWTVNGKELESNEIEDEEESWERIQFSTTEANAIVAIRIEASSEGDYDFGYLGNLDAAGSSEEGHYMAKVSGTETALVLYTVPTRGTHYIYVGYVKDSSEYDNDDKVFVQILDSLTVYMSKATITDGVAGSWSVPVRITGLDGTEGEKGARVEFVSYTTGRAYQSGAAGESVYHIAFHATYQQFFRCIQSYPASETHAPTESATNAYWEWLQGLDSLIVDVLCSNNAFLNNLTVRHMYTADGKCQILEGGYLKAVSAVIEGYIETTLVEKSNSFTVSDELNIATYGGFYSQTITLPSNPSFIGKRVTICNTNYPPYTKTSIGYYTTIAVDATAITNRIGIAGNIDVEARSGSEPAAIEEIQIRGGVVEFLGVPAQWGENTYCRWVLISGHRSVMAYTTM